MKKRLVLHAGVHRTGTTAIQRTFRDNPNTLARCGILYPRHYSPSEAEAENHQRLAWDIHSGKLDHQRFTAWVDSLAAGGEHTVVLSAEDFCILRDLQFLDVFRTAFDMEAVFYLRRQDNWVSSWYSQHKKWPFDVNLCRATPTEFLEHLDRFHWIRYFNTLERWAAELGMNNVHVRVFEKGQIEDPVADLCDLCGVNAVLDVEVGRVNERLPSDHVEILRRLGLVDYPDDIRGKINRALEKVPSEATTEIFPSSVRALILGKYAMQNQKVAEHYLRRPDRVLFRDLSMENSPASLEQSVDEARLLDFVRHLIEEFSAPEQWQVAPAQSSPPGPEALLNGCSHDAPSDAAPAIVESGPRSPLNDGADGESPNSGATIAGSAPQP